MKHPAWLVELHRQWYAARGRGLQTRSRPFSRNWPELLEAAGVISAEDIATAVREASKLEDEGRIGLKRNRYRRYLIEGLKLPASSEAWLRGLFESPIPEVLRQQSLAHLEDAAAKVHPHYPELWSGWLGSVRTAFEAGRSLRPLFWNRPGIVRQLVHVVFEITARSWPEDTLVREASVEVGLASKQLERSRRVFESCLGSMLGRPATLEMFGIVGSQPRIEIAGDLLLHFPDGRVLRIDELQGSYHLTSDLLAAVKATTPAKRILTIENTKTTLRRIASLNFDKQTLILAGSYPSQGLRRIIELLPEDLPVYHFGDTDPAGFLILSKLRQAISRPVSPFLMHRRESSTLSPLSGYDRSILPALLIDPLLEDVRPQIEALSTCGDKGDFEQETLGRPELECWPFYPCHADAKT